MSQLKSSRLPQKLLASATDNCISAWISLGDGRGDNCENRLLTIAFQKLSDISTSEAIQFFMNLHQLKYYYNPLEWNYFIRVRE